MKTLLLELFSEEIPSSMQADAANRLASAIIQAFNDTFGITLHSTQYYTPRRIAVMLEDIPTNLKAAAKEVKGPKTSAPQAAINGFMHKYNIKNIAELSVQDGCYFYKENQHAQDAENVIATLISEAISGLVWPKSMRWGNSEISWVRPLHNILCLLNEKIIPVKFGHLQANNLTFGHRFLHKEQISVSHPSQYINVLEKAYVICDPEKRKSLIKNGILNIISSKKLQLIEDEALLDEVTGIVEYPTVLLSDIPEQFMSLPKEVLLTTLRNNQKYFLLSDDSGNLAPYFVITSNSQPKNGDFSAIIEGNQKVLTARLSDAKFFWEQDRKHPLEYFAKHLEKRIFHEKIGTIGQKLKTTKVIAKKLSAEFGITSKLVVRALKLCKADLSTEMVNEFPELQGIIGKYYALADGEDEQVASAILEHYKPLGPNDDVPTTQISIILALADKIDTLTQMFKIGIRPSGSKDPYALRRAALGILRIVIHNKLDLEFENFIKLESVLEFISERARVLFEETEQKPEEFHLYCKNLGYNFWKAFYSLRIISENIKPKSP